MDLPTGQGGAAGEVGAVVCEGEAGVVTAGVKPLTSGHDKLQGGFDAGKTKHEVEAAVV
jgi:hypothetical protein